MIFYDSNYNFQSVDESLFQTLKFTSLGSMRSAIGKDFSNLFFKSKLYIYKFENICWLEFLIQNGGKAVLRFGDGKLYKTTLKVKRVENGFEIQISKSLEFLEVSKIDQNEFDKFFKLFKSSENKITKNLNISDFKNINKNILELKKYFIFFNIEELKIYLHKIYEELKKNYPDFKKIAFWWLDFSEIIEDANLSFKYL